MDAGLQRFRPWPFVFAALFFLIPLWLFYSYPSSFWAGTDYQPLGLADALNLAYRIADREMYFARGLADHPGVPFYLMSWLALALAGYPVASADPGFFDRVIEHIEDYHQITIWLGALTGAAGVYVFARAARNLVPAGVVAIGLLTWLASTPATLFMFASPSVDSFAIVINGLFFAVLVKTAHDPDPRPGVAILGAAVAAFAYLNKLSYLYVPLALLIVGLANFSFRKVDPARKRQLSILTGCTFVMVVAAVGALIIGWSGFRILVNFHKRVFLGTGLYGTGKGLVVSQHEVWRALTEIASDGAYAVPIALLGGAGLVVGGFLAGRKGVEHIPVALISIGTGFASLFSALFVLKHYSVHYTAGVSATLPAAMAAFYLLARSWGWSYRLRTVATVLATIAVLLMADRTQHRLRSTLTAMTNTSVMAKADLQEIQAYLAGSDRTAEFGYRTPFSWHGEGFVIYYASIRRLTDDYVRHRQKMFSSTAAEFLKREAGAYVVDKSRLPTVESLRAAPNILLEGPKPVTIKDGDKVIELRTVFLVIPGGRS